MRRGSVPIGMRLPLASRFATEVACGFAILAAITVDFGPDRQALKAARETGHASEDRGTERRPHSNVVSGKRSQ